MASVTMMASFLGGAGVAHRPSINNRQSLIIMAKAATRAEAQDVAKENCDGDDNKGSSGRRAAMFAAAAVAVCAAAGSGSQGIAFAIEGEPKRGTPEARKIYAPVCVTMPTARICHK